VHRRQYSTDVHPRLVRSGVSDQTEEGNDIEYRPISDVYDRERTKNESLRYSVSKRTDRMERNAVALCCKRPSRNDLINMKAVLLYSEMQTIVDATVYLAIDEAEGCA
jgi:hypothetical protein